MEYKGVLLCLFVGVVVSGNPGNDLFDDEIFSPLDLFDDLGDLLFISLDNLTDTENVTRSGLEESTANITNTTTLTSVTSPSTATTTDESPMEDSDEASGIPTEVCGPEAAQLAACDRRAICFLDPADVRGYRCACGLGYIDVSPLINRPGEVCVSAVDEASSDPQCRDFCQNDGLCQMKEGWPHCTCVERYAGARCQVPAVVLFIVFSVLLGALSLLILTFACVHQVRRYLRRTSNKRRRLVEEDDEDSSTIVYKRSNFISTLSPQKY